MIRDKNEQTKAKQNTSKIEIKQKKNAQNKKHNK